MHPTPILNQLPSWTPYAVFVVMFWRLLCRR